MPVSPNMRRKQLGAQLRQMRTDAGVSAVAAAEALDCSEAKIGHVENGRNGIRKPDLTVLLNLYGVPENMRPELDDLRKEGSKRGWWATYRMPRWLSGYVGFESDARELHAVELELIPALLQTEDYARKLHLLTTHMTAPDQVERLVEARMRRQERLDGEERLTVDFVISEAALRRTLGEPALAESQLRNIVKQAERDNVTVRILPFSNGLHETMSGSFAVMRFDPDMSLPVAYQEYAVGGHLIDDQEIIGKMSRVFDTLAAQTLSPADSLEMVTGLIDDVKEPDQ